MSTHYRQFAENHKIACHREENVLRFPTMICALACGTASGSTTLSLSLHAMTRLENFSMGISVDTTCLLLHFSLVRNFSFR